MSVVVEVELLRGTYEAGRGPDRAPSEWPPHPARLFNALVSVAETDEELDALRWLEQQAPPVVYASADIAACGGRVAYVPTNRLERGSTYGVFPARKALGPVTWNAYSPAQPTIGYEWDGDCPEPVRSALGELAERVPYLGRSTSPVIARVADEVDPALHAFRPTTADTVGPRLDIPRPGYLDALRGAFDDEQHAWEVPRDSVVYSNVEHANSETHALSPYGEVIVLGFRAGKRVTPVHAMAVASRLREAIQSHVDGGPLVLRGLPPVSRRTDAERDLIAPRHQVIVTALPFVGREHASGQLFGLAVVLPRSIEPDDRVVVLRGLAAVVRGHLELGRLGVFELDPSVQPYRTLQASTWTRPSTDWVSALPISANRFAKRVTREFIEADLLKSCADADLPDPVWIEVSRSPILPGSITISPRMRVRHRADRATASYHARIRFDAPVAGPILLGSMRRYGLGLMAPVTSSASPEGEPT